MSAMVPSTPNRKPSFSTPQTPMRPRTLHTPMTDESPEIITPVTPSPARAYRCDQELEFKPRVARRLFFTPQHGSQSHIPPSPPLTPTIAGAQTLIATPYHQPSYARPVTPPTSTTASSSNALALGGLDVAFELGSPVTLAHKNKKSKTHH